MQIARQMTHQELLDGLRQPDIEAPVRELYERYYFTIKMSILNMGGNEEDCSDIFQESVLVLIELIRTGKYRGESELKSYLNGIAKNLWLREIRTRKRRNDREQRYESGNDGITHDVHYGIFTKEVSQTLNEVFNGIGQTCKKILRGFYFDNLSMKELMQQFDYESEQVLRNKKSLCMKKIKTLLDENPALHEHMKTLLHYGQ